MEFAAVASIIAAILATLMTSASGQRELVARKMCADLCSSGLGGSPCGELCSDILQLRLEKLHHARDAAPRRTTTTAARIVGPRRSVCPLLCSYQLGDPFCACAVRGGAAELLPGDWRRICSQFCVLEGVRVFGCGACGGPQKPQTGRGSTAYVAKLGYLLEDKGHDASALGDVDWDEECKVMCQTGDGGSACSCDIPP